jgi:hypothetical protein
MRSRPKILTVLGRVWAAVISSCTLGRQGFSHSAGSHGDLFGKSIRTDRLRDHHQRVRIIYESQTPG